MMQLLTVLFQIKIHPFQQLCLSMAEIKILNDLFYMKEIPGFSPEEFAPSCSTQSQLRSSASKNQVDLLF